MLSNLINNYLSYIVYLVLFSVILFTLLTIYKNIKERKEEIEFRLPDLDKTELQFNPSPEAYHIDISNVDRSIINSEVNIEDYNTMIDILDQKNNVNFKQIVFLPIIDEPEPDNIIITDEHFDNLMGDIDDEFEYLV